ncbi:MAG: 4Fe-4S binding protein [Bacillota bacterium]|nr:4Fe-4S binding protein [Bacillota bacterium]
MRDIIIRFKRRIIQIAAFGFSNSHVQNFAVGRIYEGKWKQFCNPGLNCYSCPAAGLACPIGALQAVNGSQKYSVSLYVTGFLLATGVLFGRAVCGFICPFGFIQELLSKIPLPKFRLPGGLKYIKYGILVLFVLIIPAAVTNYFGVGEPAFCKYICPAGTLEAGIPLLLANEGLRSIAGGLFGLKSAILLVIIIGCIFCRRFFCKVACPLGAVYGLLNRISLYHMDIDEDKCISCGKCARVCMMDINPVDNPNSAECIRCGKCRSGCPAKAIHMGFRNMP